MRKRLCVWILVGIMGLQSNVFAAEKLDLSKGITLPVGDLSTDAKEPEAAVIDDEEVSRIERCMRAYVPTSDCLVKNDAENFYYYSQLDQEVQDIYDTMLMVTEDPAAVDNFSVYFTDNDPFSEEFSYKVKLALYAMWYDHPEFFWLYNFNETSMIWYANPESNGMYTVYFGLSNPVPDFEEQQNAFNEAAEAFLAEIDTSQTEVEVTKAIHDKLIDLVTYDLDVLGNLSTSGENLAHTAYGALVQNSNGQANHAVCDGYSLAFEYLLQQAGIEATVITGFAGNQNEELGGHAWSAVKIDDKWYEVDSTWDDAGTIEEQFMNTEYESVVKEAFSDEEYKERLQHYLYTINTDDMTNYVVNKEYYTYTTNDEEVEVCFVSDSVHMRKDEGSGAIGAVIEYAPLAE